MAQIVTKFIQDNAVTDGKIRLQNAGWLRARNAANSADINILEVDSSNTIQFGSTPQVSSPVVNPNDISNKAYVDLAAANMSDKNLTEFFTLASGDITNGYITLSNPAFNSSVYVEAGGVGQILNTDYSLSNPTTNTQVTFLSPLSSILGVGDEITVTYTIATSLGSQQPSGKFTLSQILTTQVTGRAPAAFGEYRAMYRSASGDVYSDATPSVAPSASNLIPIYSDNYYDSAGTITQPVRYQFYVGLNKAFQELAWVDTSQAAAIDISKDYAPSFNVVVGFVITYNPANGVLTMTRPVLLQGHTGHVMGLQDDGSFAPSGVADFIISDNPVHIGTVGLYTGMIVPMGTGTAPFGLLECDGSAVSRIQYARLFSVIGTNYGIGDGSTTFNIPDLRGLFPRGWNHGSGNDPDASTRSAVNGGNSGDAVGSYQADQNQDHVHYAATYNGEFLAPVIFGAGGSGVGTWTSGGSGGNQANPRNTSVMYCIVY